MIWKILTYFYFFVFITFGVLNIGQSVINTPSLVVESVLSFILSIFIIGTFISLGWKRQFFDRGMIKYMIASIVAFFILEGIFMYPSLYTESFIYYPETTMATIIASVFVLINLLIVFLLYLPFYIGLYKYSKNCENFDKIDKPYWKSFVLVSSISFIVVIIAFLFNYKHFIEYNVMDYFVVFSGIYDIAFLIGFAFDKQILNKLFWKISAIPYIVLCGVSPLLLSETLKQDFNLVNITPSYIVYYLFLSAIYVYVLIKYAYGKETQKIEAQE